MPAGLTLTLTRTRTRTRTRTLTRSHASAAAAAVVGGLRRGSGVARRPAQFDDDESFAPPEAEAAPRSVRRELWRESALDLAAFEDGKLAQACMMVVSHRHSQYVLDHTFAGNYTGSRACIPNDTSLLVLILQSLLFFLPGWVVTVKAPTFGTHATMSDVQSAEWDPDLRGIVDGSNSDKVGPRPLTSEP